MSDVEFPDLPFLCIFIFYAAVVESLINDGKQIAAVHFIHAFQLNERFAPVPLLKAYLKDLRRNSQGKAGGGIAGVKACFDPEFKLKIID